MHVCAAELCAKTRKKWRTQNQCLTPIREISIQQAHARVPNTRHRGGIEVPFSVWQCPAQCGQKVLIFRGLFNAKGSLRGKKS